MKSHVEKARSRNIYSVELSRGFAAWAFRQLAQGNKVELWGIGTLKLYYWKARRTGFGPVPAFYRIKFRPTKRLHEAMVELARIHGDKFGTKAKRQDGARPKVDLNNRRRKVAVPVRPKEQPADGMAVPQPPQDNHNPGPACGSGDGTAQA